MHAEARSTVTYLAPAGLLVSNRLRAIPCHLSRVPGRWSCRKTYLRNRKRKTEQHNPAILWWV